MMAEDSTPLGPTVVVGIVVVVVVVGIVVVVVGIVVVVVVVGIVVVVETPTGSVVVVVVSPADIVTKPARNTTTALAVTTSPDNHPRPFFTLPPRIPTHRQGTTVLIAVSMPSDLDEILEFRATRKPSKPEVVVNWRNSDLEAMSPAI
jgi:hypothetical protein